MKTECQKVTSTHVSESRKVRKPLMEKKRRARINDSLETLKQILLESKTTLKESTNKKNGQRTAKLEKADILEMTVSYLQHLRNKLNNNKQCNKNVQKTKNEEIVITAGNNNNSCENIKMGVTLIPTKLSNGEIVFVMPSNLQAAQQKITFQNHYSVKMVENVWRPW